jgi:hypothetical protein
MKAHLCALILVSACAPSTNESDRALESEEGDVDSDECKLEDDAIGVEKMVIDLGSKSVRVHDWVGKTGSPGEYVGFSLTTGGASIAYRVKASGEVYPSSELTWMHPNGADGGSQSPGISNIDFCDECDDPDGCEGDGGGDDDGCDNPDGCEPPPPPPPSDPVLN